MGRLEVAKGVVVKAAATVEVDMEEAVMVEEERGVAMGEVVMVEEAMEQEPIGD